MYEMQGPRQAVQCELADCPGELAAGAIGDPCSVRSYCRPGNPSESRFSSLPTRNPVARLSGEKSSTQFSGQNPGCPVLRPAAQFPALRPEFRLPGPPAAGPVSRSSDVPEVSFGSFRFRR